MRQLIITLLSVLFFVPLFGQNCQSDSSFATPFIHPDNDSISCIIRGAAYSTTLTFRNFDSVPLGPFTIPIDSLSIDSITNLPCGISWLSGKSPNKMYLPHELDCILITGTTNDSVGQYHLGIHVTYYTGGIGQPYNFDSFGYKKFLRVKDSTTITCPVIVDTLTSQTATCSGLIVYVVGHTEICQGDSTALRAFVQNGNGHYTYLWSTGDTAVLIGVNQAGTYSVTVSDGSWTAAASNTVRIDPVVVPSVSYIYQNEYGDIDTLDRLICTGHVKQSVGDGYIIVMVTNAGNSPHYDWLLDGRSLGLDSNRINIGDYLFSGNGVFDTCGQCKLTCKVTSSILCARPNFVTSDSFIVGGCGGGIGEFINNNLISIFPNPSNGKFAISINEPCHTIVIELHDIQGALLYKEKQNEVVSLKKELDFSQLSKGIYLLKVTTENGVAVKRIVIQ